MVANDSQTAAYSEEVQLAIKRSIRFGIKRHVLKSICEAQHLKQVVHCLRRVPDEKGHLGQMVLFFATTKAACWTLRRGNLRPVHHGRYRCNLERRRSRNARYGCSWESYSSTGSQEIEALAGEGTEVGRDRTVVNWYYGQPKVAMYNSVLMVWCASFGGNRWGPWYHRRWLNER